MSAPTGTPTLQDLTRYLGVYFTVANKLRPSQTFISTLAAVIIWDYLVTLPDEIRLIWLAGISPLNALLLVTRYYLLSVAASDPLFIYWPSGNVETCAKLCRFLPYSSMVAYALGNSIMIIRLFALWDKSKLVLAGMSTLLLAQLLAQIIVPLSATPVPIPPALPGLPIPALSACLPARIKYYWLFFAFPSLFDLVAFSLSTVSLARLWRRGSKTDLVRTLLKDGSLMFLMSLTASTANLIWFSTAEGTNRNPAFLAPLGPIVHSICSYRLVFSLRKTASKSRSPQISSYSASGSSGARKSKSGLKHMFSRGEHSSSFSDAPLSPIQHGSGVNPASSKPPTFSSTQQPVDVTLAGQRHRQDSTASDLSMRRDDVDVGIDTEKPEKH